MRTLREADYRRMPWKNGGGETIEMMVSPAGASFDTFDWRVSMAYVGEPAALKRESIGAWVVLFLAFFTFLAYLVKMEYWRDIH